MNGSGQATGGNDVATAFRKQIGWCTGLGAPFTAQLLTVLAEDLRAGGTTARLVGAWLGDPVADAVPLRLAGAFHALVLSSADAGLAACYPPGGSGDPERLRSAVSAALQLHEAFIRGFLASPPQTNEVGRSAVLLGGFLHVAAETRLPLRVLEIGSSAGLNLHWDRYRYRIAGADWGDPDSTVRLAPDWTGEAPPLAAGISVAERAGCDVAPLDLTRPEARLRLRSYVWADQPERLARIDAAIAVALAAGTTVEQEDAADWAAARLRSPVQGRATVLFHSIMWQYMPADTQAALQATIGRAGAAATAVASFAWLRFEPPGNEGRPELRLTRWPGGQESCLATAHPHGTAVTWLGVSPTRP